MPIEFHESEYLKSRVDPEVLLYVLDNYGQEAKDSLLYKDDEECKNSYNGLSKIGGSR